MNRTEENRQEYKELQRRVKRKVSKAKQKAYDELYTRLDTREGQKDLYRLARQRDQDGKDVQQALTLIEPYCHLWKGWKSHEEVVKKAEEEEEEEEEAVSWQPQRPSSDVTKHLQHNVSPKFAHEALNVFVMSRSTVVDSMELT
ncbi:hypothetical protein QTP70_006884 [Hemibagrus guttatus]|uniref:Uncharacterized protein n=1 Tax=Hemibagrus guttatus TaxID=175788 RepID=A0AAE0RGI5_9TELE|nr:hypothetical protein QTP70_006884 [Hemibagrus guttatus]